MWFLYGACVIAVCTTFYHYLTHHFMAGVWSFSVTIVLLSFTFGMYCIEDHKSSNRDED